MKTATEFVILLGENMPNHSQSMAGRGRYVRISGYGPANSVPLVRTREEAYRLAANLLCKAQALPNEDESVTWDDMLEAVMEETATNELDVMEEDAISVDE